MKNQAACGKAGRAHKRNRTTPPDAASRGFFRLPSSMRPDPAVDAWLGAQAPELGAIARSWFGELRRAGPDVRELIHDGCPVACVGDIAFGYVNVFKSHVNVGFFFGADLDDPADLLMGAGKRMRHVKLRPDVPYDAVALRRLIEDAYAHIGSRMRGTQGVA